MRILVSGNGRSGTCLLAEVVRGLGLVNFSENLEDRKFFKYEKLPENYGTKLVTDNPTFSFQNMKLYMGKYQNLYFVFSLRHPIDIFLSKIRRGQKASDGGDRPGEDVAPDSTVETAVVAIKDFHKKYKFIINNYPDRSYSVKLEDLLLSPQKTVNKVADFFRVEPTEEAFKFYEYDRNRYHHKRYKKQIDLSQVGLYKRWDTIYDRFFKNKKRDIEYAEKELKHIIKDLNYYLEVNYE